MQLRSQVRYHGVALPATPLFPQKTYCSSMKLAITQFLIRMELPSVRARYLGFVNAQLSLIALSYTIERDRKGYYDQLEQHQKTLDITP